MKKIMILSIPLVIFFISGCAEIQPPNPVDIITSPFGSATDSHIGDNKDDVISRWGEPDEKNEIGVDEIGVKKEQWVYYGRYPMAPVDYRYISKTKYLYFEGNALVRQETKPGPQPKAQQQQQEKEPEK
ncbi:MAG: hypothetical protein JW946_05965 [Candidatus Omnitrophica bacterium]|nr:hypothetical protein [Candidatus Omnitrophota bacterium]